MIKYTNNIYKGYEKAVNVIRIGKDFEKSAYEMSDPIKEFISTLEPKEGVSYDWINAMGAGEVYGANSRGDYFPREELKAHHESFVTNPAHVYVQHVNKDPLIKLGDVLFSHYNDDTDRVELIQSLEEDRIKKYAPDWVKYMLQRGENYNTSMGTKVAYDECSVCGQKNKTIADYCGHLKTAMNDWVDGKHVHAINIAPNFFDNSIVRRGADKVARKIDKVASYDYNPSKTLLTDNELYNITNKKYFFLNENIKTASEKEPYINENNIAVIDKTISSLDIEQLQKLSEYPLENVLGLFKQADYEILPHEYQYLVLSNIDPHLADNYYYNDVRFAIPNKGGSETIKLSSEVDPDLLDFVSETLIYKTLSEPILLYKSIIEGPVDLTEKSGNPVKTAEDEILNFIGKSYVDYLNTSIEKTANIMDIILGIFLSAPDILERHRAKNRAEEARDKNRASVYRTNPVGTLPAPYNPLFKSEFLEKNSGFFSTVGKYKNVLGGLALLGGGAAATAYYAGDSVKKEQAGDPTANEGFGGMARRHPFATTLGLAGGGYLAYKGLKAIPGAIKNKFKKTSSADDFEKLDSEYVNNYRNFLKEQSPEFILDIIETIPKNLFENICYI